jgi:hypothetical protein
MNNWCICWFFTHIFTGYFNFKGLTARRLYKSFGVKGLILWSNRFRGKMSASTWTRGWRRRSAVKSGNTQSCRKTANACLRNDGSHQAKRYLVCLVYWNILSGQTVIVRSWEGQPRDTWRVSGKPRQNIVRAVSVPIEIRTAHHMNMIHCHVTHRTTTCITLPQH